MAQDFVTVKRLNGQPYPCEIAITGYVLANDDRWVVYGLTDPRNGEVFYVGKTCKVIRRLKAHCKFRSPRSSLEKRKLSIAAQKLAVGCVILGVYGTANEADEGEQRFMDRYKPTLLNVQLTKWKETRRYE